jgi:DNA polymerase-1
VEIQKIARGIVIPREMLADYVGMQRTYAPLLRPDTRTAAERAAANMPIQGTEADLMKLAMIEVDKRLDGRGEQLLQIHDSILIECPKDNAEAISDMLVDTMENIYPNLGVRLQVDVHTGDNWGEV